MEDKKSYTVYVRCNNCEFSGVRTIPFGKTVACATCPTCGCNALQLKESATWTTKTETFVVDLDKKFDKLNDIFSKLGKDFEDLFKK